jgi:hypothetical protein
MQKTVNQAFNHDVWRSDEHPCEGVRRVQNPVYTVDDPQEQVVVMRYEPGPEEETQNEFAIQTRTISEANLDNALAAMICVMLKTMKPLEVHVDRLKGFMAEHKLTDIFVHPDFRLPEGVHAIRHNQFPRPLNTEACEVYACTENAGVIVNVPKNGTVELGGFLRPRQFTRLNLIAPIPSALDAILSDDDD